MDDVQTPGQVSDTIEQLIAPVAEIAYRREANCVHCGNPRFTVTQGGMRRTEGCDCDNDPLAHMWK